MTDVLLIVWYSLFALGLVVTVAMLYHFGNLLKEKSYRSDLRRFAPYLGHLYLLSSQCLTEFGVHHRKQLGIFLLLWLLVFGIAGIFDALVDFVP